MTFNFEAAIWYLILLDCLGANLIAWFFADWYRGKFGRLHRYFPLTKAWGFVYLGLVLWVGGVLCRLEILPW